MREWLDFDASSSTANPRNETVPTEGQEPSSEVRLDRLRNYATYYKAERQDEQIKRKQARDAAARTVAEASAANATPTHKYRPNMHHTACVPHPKPNARLELGRTDRGYT
jgi:hypothetical protein